MEDQRYPLSVRLTGMMHKEKSKMYMTSVLWSDQSDITVYRTFREFKDLHKQLKKAFPTTKQLKKSERILPKFRDMKAKQSGPGKKGPKKSLLRLKFLQKYCNELLSCDPRVTQSGDLIQFFHPKEQDLRPDFSKNSILIMPSDEDANGGHLGAGNVTTPFVTETYRCVAPYETKDTKNKAFKVALDEKVDVLIKDKAGWWLVENESKQMAWFPAPYLEKLDDDDMEDELDGVVDRGTLCTAIKSYKATKNDEISVSIGAVVELLQKSNNGWWFIRYNGKTGYVPTMYLQPYSNPHLRMGGHHQDRRAPPSMLEQSHQLSHSQGNLQLLLPPVRSSTPNTLQPESRQRSLSLNVLSDEPPAQPAAPRTSVTSVATKPSAVQRAAAAAAPPPPPPTIMVEMDGEEEVCSRSQRAQRVASFESSSDSSSDFSSSDELNSSSASSSFSPSPTANTDKPRLGRTPQPAARNRLSPSAAPQGKLMPSVSNPDIFRAAASPKVPPRPRAQEILTRCTTVTRKNASRGGLSPTPPQILSQ